MKILINLAMGHSRLLLLIIYLGLTVSGCKKYLEAKPDQSIATPSTVEDLEGILNNYAFINARYPSAAEVSADNYYLKGSDWSSLIDIQRNLYTWQKYDLIGGDYTAPYSAIEYANIVLDAVPKIPLGDRNRLNIVKGNALFLRASYHYALAQLYCKVYLSSSASKDLGIPLRLNSDVAMKPSRSSVSQTYTAIIADLQAALPLLPLQADAKYHAGKPAVFGQLARVYLSMSDYDNAGKYADSAINLYSKLIDYNTVSKTSAIPFVQFNDEVIYDARTAAPQALANSRAKIDTSLYRSYAADDLRKVVLFKANADGSYGFKGNYTGQNNAAVFTGIATDELFFIKAECAARNGKTSEALVALNKVLSTRWKKGTFVDITTTDKDLLLETILSERRKELVFRNLRWTDLRRFNLELTYNKTLVRNINGTVYSLSKGSDRYVLQLDRSAVEISGLQQNP
ncbi:RagB/SusD family nutrient uptake outer membrane protein [Mucilaginibacter sp. SMC90]|uniref:RagB/SusD family nutrient uptake outer membrane protein n=1 Tax=Mucilaginibacter sp. SMC90 TaxID=2929803 RepID=UPI001FB1C448|nr:RagB/SusD family nutrient uptake outer membrane protein [Mucilaginibacter sp. SMC90]UOE52558.1 RagB/SusD family nutrient uptake outer membrane protein [Mucilaginibacter sp. SMC90]